MARINKKDRGFLYSRATHLSQQALDMDVWADQLIQDAMPARGEAHRAIAEAMRAEARECRKWADTYAED